MMEVSTDSAMDLDTGDESMDNSFEEAKEFEDEDCELEDPSKKKSDIEESDSVRFCPPVYLQRYCRVRETLEGLLNSPKYKELCHGTGKTVMEVGCAEFGMMVHLKSLLDIGKILFLDLDEETMQEKLHFLKPLPAEYLQRTSRPQALEVEAYVGCVTRPDSDVFRQNPDVWAVVGIEIIEHLHADILRGFEETVFGVIAPYIVIVTTPNSDFNEVFNLPPGKFRHWDHKFEWSRMEFKNWCEKIVGEFKDYTYRIEGICEGPQETRKLGCVSQMAVFEKKDNAVVPSNSSFSWRLQNSSYKLLYKVTFPNYIETRSSEEIIVSEVEYFVSNFIFSRSMLNQYYELDTKEVKIRLGRILTIGDIRKVCNGDEEFFKSVLEKNGYKIVSEDNATSLLINVDEYLSANICSDSSSEDDEELELCEDLAELDVNRVIPIDDESWE